MNKNIHKTKQKGILTYEEEIELARLSNKGENAEATEKLISGTRPLVEAIAERYVHYLVEKGVKKEDAQHILFQKGMEGVRKAITKYNPERGYKFSTYATWWIREEIEKQCAK